MLAMSFCFLFELSIEFEVLVKKNGLRPESVAYIKSLQLNSFNPPGLDRTSKGMFTTRYNFNLKALQYLTFQYKYFPKLLNRKGAEAQRRPTR